MPLSTDEAMVVGEEPGRSFTLRFHGQAGLANRRLNKLLGLGRTANGWRDFHASTPTGLQTRVFFDTDKNSRQQRQELLGRRLAKSLRSTFPKNKVQHKRADGVLSLDFVPLGRIIVESEALYRLDWNTVLVQERGIIKQDLETQLASAVADPAASIAWG